MPVHAVSVSRSCRRTYGYLKVEEKGEGSVVKDLTSICRERRDLNSEDPAYLSGHQVAGGQSGIRRETNSACAYEQAMKLIVI